MKIAWVTGHSFASKCDTDTSNISPSPSLGPYKVHRPWALFCEDTVIYMCIHIKSLPVLCIRGSLRLAPNNSVLHLPFLSLQPFPNLLTEGSEFKDLFSSRGETWKTTRKTLSPSFSASKLKMVRILVFNLWHHQFSNAIYTTALILYSTSVLAVS